MLRVRFSFFSFTHWPPTDFYPFSLHDALPISKGVEELQAAPLAPGRVRHEGGGRHALTSNDPGLAPALEDRKSTRLNSSHANNSYAVFCLKKKRMQRIGLLLMAVISSLRRLRG